MDQEDELAEWRTKTYRLIGRNVLLFQQMEQLLKDLLPRATNSISFDTDVQVARAERYAEVEKCTLGNLVNRFIDEVCDPDEPTSSDEPDGPRLKLTFRLSWKMVRRICGSGSGWNWGPFQALSRARVGD